MQISQDRRGVARTERHAEAVRAPLGLGGRRRVRLCIIGAGVCAPSGTDAAEAAKRARHGGQLSGARREPRLPKRQAGGPAGDPCIMMRMLAAAPADPRGDPYILINQGHPGSWNVHGSMHDRRTPTLTLAPPVAQPALQPASFDQLPLISAAPPVAGRLFSIRKG